MYLSTDGVAPSQRVALWAEAINRYTGSFWFDPGDVEHFHGEIDIRNVFGIRAARLVQNARAARRRHEHLSHVAADTYTLILQLRGWSHFRQAGRDLCLPADSFTLIDPLRPIELHFSDDNEQLSFQLPRTAVEDVLGGQSAPILLRIDGTEAAVTAAMLKAAYERCADPLLHTNNLFHRALLFAGLALLPAESDKPDRSLIQRVRTLIDRQLDSSDLTPAFIAAECGVSLRHLHRVFTRTGSTVADWVKERRLARCAEALRDPGQGHVSMTQIALRWGFNDSAHFSRCFRARFGVSPRRYRVNSLAP